MSYDTKCYDLAADWLDGAMNTEENRVSLAQAIQNACENWDMDHEPHEPREETTARQEPLT